MSKSRNLRDLERFDYKIYSNTGKKIAKEYRALENIENKFQVLSTMSTANLCDEEEKVCLKIKRFIEEYNLDLLFDIQDIENAIFEFKKLIESYEEVHIELKRELGDQHETQYVEFEEKYKSMSDWVINARLEIKRKKIEQLKIELEKEEQLRKGAIHKGCPPRGGRGDLANCGQNRTRGEGFKPSRTSALNFFVGVYFPFSSIFFQLFVQFITILGNFLLLLTTEIRLFVVKIRNIKKLIIIYRFPEN